MRANLSENMVNDLLKSVFRDTGYKHAVPYSMRKSAAKWWSMCGAREWEIKNGGRWISNSWFEYVQNGSFEGQLSIQPCDLPIRKMWVWRSNTFEMKEHRELRSSHFAR